MLAGFFPFSGFEFLLCCRETSLIMLSLRHGNLLSDVLLKAS